MQVFFSERLSTIPFINHLKTLLVPVLIWKFILQLLEKTFFYKMQSSLESTFTKTAVMCGKLSNHKGLKRETIQQQHSETQYSTTNVTMADIINSTAE